MNLQAQAINDYFTEVGYSALEDVILGRNHIPVLVKIKNLRTVKFSQLTKRQKRQVLSTKISLDNLSAKCYNELNSN